MIVAKANTTMEPLTRYSPITPSRLLETPGRKGCSLIRVLSPGWNRSCTGLPGPLGCTGPRCQRTPRTWPTSPVHEALSPLWDRGVPPACQVRPHWRILPVRCRNARCGDYISSGPSCCRFRPESGGYHGCQCSCICSRQERITIMEKAI